jgi:hypothetical protein
MRSSAQSCYLDADATWIQMLKNTKKRHDRLTVLRPTATVFTVVLKSSNYKPYSPYTITYSCSQHMGTAAVTLRWPPPKAYAVQQLPQNQAFRPCCTYLWLSIQSRLQWLQLPQVCLSATLSCQLAPSTCTQACLNLQARSDGVAGNKGLHTACSSPGVYRQR